MSVTAVYADNRLLRLGRRVGKGGEGEVYTVDGDDGVAVKIYTGADAKSREPKINAMIKASLSSKAPLVAFPTAVARSRDGGFVGFTMKLIRDHKPLHELYSPGSRKHNFPQSDYRFLVRSAANIARAVASVHASGCVIGDINHSGVLISNRATAALIDADSFQISAGSEIFGCKVGVPEYTPPELQGHSLASVIRTPNHDCFGLAVIIFQLLFMGRHPFVGTVRRGDIPPLHEAIRDHRFVYAENRDVGMDQPPGTPALSAFSAELAASLDAAFGRNARDHRPTAAQWVELLDELERSLTTCDANKLHFIPRDADDCPWCEMESALGTILFLPYVAPAELLKGHDPGAPNFNLDGILRQIAAISLPPRNQLLPKVSNVGGTLAPQPSNTSASPFTLKKIGCVIAGLGVMVLVPQAWLLGLILIAYGIFSSASQPARDDTALLNRTRDVESRWNRELIAWQQRVGVDDFLKLQQELREAADAYKKLDDEERRDLETYRRERRSKQLDAYLDNFEIQKAKIKGIGPAKQAALASYGIETAADVALNKVLAVPGFGPTNAQELITWRNTIANRFVYSEVQNETDYKELNRITFKKVGRAIELRKKLVVGPQNLGAVARRVLQARDTEDPLLNKINDERQRIKAELTARGLTPPHVPIEWPPAISPNVPAGHPRATPQPHTPNTAGSPAPQPSGGTWSPPSSTPSCPRCGSRMVRRLARRGRRAGHSFWGCSRYPVCRGTRN